MDKNQRIVFEKLKDNSRIDKDGIAEDGWVEERKAWAFVNHRSGSMRWSGGNYDPEVSDIFTVNYVKGWEPTTEMRIIWKDKAYKIQSVEDIREEHLDVEIRAINTSRVRG